MDSAFDAKELCEKKLDAGLQETMMDLMNLKPPQITFYASAFSVLLTLHFTIQLVSQHLFHWKNPKEQKAIIIIVLMAPIYAVVSFIGLLDVKGSEIFFLFLESIKECYEALVSILFWSLYFGLIFNVIWRDLLIVWLFAGHCEILGIDV